MTSAIPSIESLESVHTFPGRYTFKLIGANDAAFSEAAVAAALELVGNAAYIRRSDRQSKGGRFLSVTLDIRVENAHHVRALYDAFSHLPGLRMML